MYGEAYRETLITSDVFVTPVYVLVPGMDQFGFTNLSCSFQPPIEECDS